MRASPWVATRRRSTSCRTACGGNRSSRLLTGLDASISMLALSAFLICVNFIFVILKLLDAAPSSRAKGNPGKKSTPPCPMNSYVSP